MIKKLFGLCFLILFLACGAFAEEKNSPRITSLEIRGQKNVSEEAILDAIFSRVGENISENSVKNDIKGIFATGYFDDVQSKTENFGGGTKIIYIVKENPLIASVSLEGNTVFSNKKLLTLIETRPNAVLNYKKIQTDIKKINELYAKDGYVLARVVDVATDLKKHQVKFIIVEGILESISLSGNDTTKDYVILREMKTQIGKPLNKNILGKDLRRIFNLGYFSEVNPVFNPGTQPDKVALVLDIKEGRTNTINFGGGYGEREGWFGFTDLAINNLMGTGQALMLRGQMGQELNSYQFKYYNPWFIPNRLGEKTSFTGRVWYTVGRDIYSTRQDEIHQGWDVAFGKYLFNHEEFLGSVTLGSEKVRPYLTASFEAYQSDTIGLTLSYDTRDFWMNPKEGIYISFATKFGVTRYAVSENGFVKYSLDNNFYIPTFQNQVFAFHVGAGIGLGNVPIGEVFWVGGENTVRGYNPFEAKTGTKKLLANFEYRLDFNETFQGVFFFDWGNAWSNGFIAPSDFIAGWGPGIRLNTPMGPIRLDYGIPISQDGGGRIHFSIGQAF